MRQPHVTSDRSCRCSPVNTRRAGIAATLLMTAMALTACGDDSDGPKSDPEHDKAVTALSKRVEADNKIDAKHRVVSRKEADCVAASLVDDVGVDKLVKLKVLKKDLSSATLPDVLPKPLRKPQVNALSECVGLVDYWMRSTHELMRAVAATPAAKKKANDDAFWKAATSCLKDKIDEKTMREVMLESITKPEAAQRRIAPQVGKCEKQLS